MSQDSEMFDSIDPSQIPAGQDDAGYVDGRWPTFTALHGPHNLSIAVFAADNADALDDEPGDATNAQVPSWVKRELGLGHWRPCVYTSISNTPAMLAALAAAGITRSQVRVWTAHYNYTRHRCTNACWAGLPAGFVADATQWTDHSGGRNLDESSVAADFFAPAPPPAPIHIPPKEVRMFLANDGKTQYIVCESAAGVFKHALPGGAELALLSGVIPNQPTPMPTVLNSIPSVLPQPTVNLPTFPLPKTFTVTTD